MAGRKVGSEQEARRCLAAARAAGERAGDWARTHGIDGLELPRFRGVLLAVRKEDHDAEDETAVRPCPSARPRPRSPSAGVRPRGKREG